MYFEKKSRQYRTVISAIYKTAVQDTMSKYGIYECVLRIIFLYFVIKWFFPTSSSLEFGFNLKNSLPNNNHNSF